MIITQRTTIHFEKYPDIVTVRDLMSMLNICKSTAYSLLKDQQIKNGRIGRKYIIPKQSVIDFVSENVR